MYSERIRCHLLPQSRASNICLLFTRSTVCVRKRDRLGQSPFPTSHNGSSSYHYICACGPILDLVAELVAPAASSQPTRGGIFYVLMSFLGTEPGNWRVQLGNGLATSSTFTSRCSSICCFTLLLCDVMRSLRPAMVLYCS